MRDEREREISNFAHDLKALCEKALELKKHIYACIFGKPKSSYVLHV